MTNDNQRYSKLFFGCSDTVSYTHLPLLDSTKKMINADAIAMMKPTAIVLNLSLIHI